jgi:hypothetical protein
MTCGWNNVGAEPGKSGCSHRSQAQWQRASRFEITQPILLALLSQGKLSFWKRSASPQSQVIQRASRSFTCTPLGLKPRTHLEVPVSRNGLYQWVYINPEVVISLFFLLPIYCQIAKCDSDPSKLNKTRLKWHHQWSTFFINPAASTWY